MRAQGQGEDPGTPEPIAGAAAGRGRGRQGRGGGSGRARKRDAPAGAIPAVRRLPGAGKYLFCDTLEHGMNLPCVAHGSRAGSCGSCASGCCPGQTASAAGARDNPLTNPEVQVADATYVTRNSAVQRLLPQAIFSLEQRCSSVMCHQKRSRSQSLLHNCHTAAASGTSRPCTSENAERTVSWQN